MKLFCSSMAFRVVYSDPRYHLQRGITFALVVFVFSAISRSLSELFPKYRAVRPKPVFGQPDVRVVHVFPALA
jgi:hypothetical protein